jgi:hypothetical protein
MKFAGALVKHLGLQMYSGAVPAIAELIANAWDADASVVRVTIPLDVPISHDQEISVYDDGHGMDFDEVNDKYLMLGRDRRVVDGDYTKAGRHALGRKGIGKLAGFGIAKVVEVWTVKDGHLTAFEMDYDKITSDASTIERYEPNLLRDRPVTATDPIQQGTLVKLRRLQLKNKVNGSRFRLGMTRRFALLSATFRVYINEEELRREEQPLQFRFPESGMNTDEVPGIGTIQWWAGFTEKPIKVEESRGISVLARGKIAQAPFFFELAGGATSQLGLQYLTGEVIADGLDDNADLIATDRASVLWEHPGAKPLLEWGQRKIGELLREWGRGRHKAQVRRLRDTTQYMAQVERFPEREQKELLSAIGTLASIETITNERLDEIVRIMIHAYENDHFLGVIRALRDIDEQSQDEITNLIQEWDVIEAVQTAQLVRGRVEIILTFESMIDHKVPEKPDMQEFLKTHPWLINPKWQMLEHEKSLENVLEKRFNTPKAVEKRNGRRLDFLCLADSEQAVVVEVKRPGARVHTEELRQLEDYLVHLNTWNEQSTGGEAKRSKITGVLIYSRMDDEAKELARRMRENGDIVVTWSSLLETAQRLHRDYLDVVKARAP